MAKSNRPNPKSQPSPVRPSAAAPIAPLKNRLINNTNHPENDNFFRNIFAALSIFILVFMLMFSFGSGINADDKFQNDYCEKLVSYYSTFGKDTSALFVKDGNMHLYGGFFEVVTGFTNKALGYSQTDLGYHHVRHFTSALMGWVAIICAGLLAYWIAGWQSGIITLVILFLSPRFIGDAMMNPKDIPFAAGYMLALYNMVRVFDAMPKPEKRHLWGLVAGLAIGLATRAGGLLPFVYLFFFGGLHWLLNGWIKNETATTEEKFSILKKYLGVTIGVALVSYALAVLFWPYALQNPLSNPLKALSQFSALEVKIRVLFEGKNIMSDVTPWYYVAKWIAITIPLAALVGFLGFVTILLHLMKKHHRLWLFLIFFAAFFPVFYVIYKDSILHDGWRHLTFAYPPMVVGAALFWNGLTQLFKEIKFVRWATIGLMSLMLLDAGAFILSNSKFPYTYFNPLVGGIKGAFGHYETDYWGVSVRQGIGYLEKNEILKPNMTDTVTIATNMYYAAKMLCAKYNGHARVRYLKWDRRCDDAWDYALFPTRFIDGNTLQKGFWPPDNVVHTVTAGGVPILAVLKSDGNPCYEANNAAKRGDLPRALEYYKQEVAKVPDNDLAWSGLANIYLSLNNLDSANLCAQKALEINPDDSQANNLLGLVLINRGDAAAAKKQFENALQREPSNAAAWYYLALLAHNSGDNGNAMNYVKNAIEIAPTFKPAYQLGLQISEATGNNANVQMFKNALNQLK